MDFVKVTQLNDIPKGCNQRQNIEIALRYHHDRTERNSALFEYGNLLQLERLFEKQQPGKLLAIQGKFKNFPVIPSYTDYGSQLMKRFPDNWLIKVIVDGYKLCVRSNSRSTRELQCAMVEFDNLMEVQIAYSKMTKNSDLSKTYHPSSDRPKNEPAVNNKANSFTSHPTSGQAYKPAQQGQQDERQSMSVSSSAKNINGHIYYPEQMYKQLDSLAQQRWEELKRLQDDVKVKSKEIDELRNRLSGLASKQLTQGNPDFTDLSDKNRPMKIAERFHTMYDDEWTSALEALTHEKKGKASQTEEQAIQFLMEIIKTGYNFCSHYADKQKRTVKELWLSCLDNPFRSAYSVDASKSATLSIPEAVTSTFIEMRKARPEECIKSVIEAFRENNLSTMDLYKRKKEQAVDDFADKCIHNIWLMRIQDPPMFMKWPEYGDKFDTETYKEYCRKGSVVKLAVWPAIFLHEKGSLMNKGYVMPQ